MNSNLTTAILAHLFSGFGVLDFGDHLSIRHLDFRTKHMIEFYDDQDREEASLVYACQTTVNAATLKLLYVELVCNHSDYVDSDLILLSQLEGCPMYGCFLSCDDMREPTTGFIACKFKDNWMPCSVYLQATFLAGMEQLRDLTGKYEPCKDLGKLPEELKSFIQYRETFLEIEEAGHRE
jgi:hypothetical protein